jgi:hypothetical protein
MSSLAPSVSDLVRFIASVPLARSHAAVRMGDSLLVYGTSNYFRYATVRKVAAEAFKMLEPTWHQCSFASDPTTGAWAAIFISRARALHGEREPAWPSTEGDFIDGITRAIEQLVAKAEPQRIAEANQAVVGMAGNVFTPHGRSTDPFA